jgi:hypothetical protein
MVVAFHGCSADWGPAEQADQVDGEIGCAGFSEDSGIEVEWIDAGNGPRSVVVFNRRDVDTIATLTKTVVAPEGTVSSELGKVTIRARGSSIVPVPASELEVGADKASLHVTGKAVFTDGRRGWHAVNPVIVGGTRHALVEESGAVLQAGPFAAVQAASFVKKLCFRYPGTFAVGAGEDLFAEGVPTVRPARGMQIDMTVGPSLDPRSDKIPYSFMLGPDGCRTMSIISGFATITASTSGSIASADFTVLDNAQDGAIQRFTFIGTITNSTATQTIDFDPTASSAAHAFNAFQGAGWVLYSLWSGGAAEVTLIANAKETNSSYSAASNTVSLQIGKHASKEAIGHELGHWAMDVLTDFPTGNSCGSGHSALSLENQRCALSEGFGNFYAAASFNLASAGQTDCYYGSNNCATGLSVAGSCSDKTRSWTAVMENCVASASWPGNGNETDWSRVLWNMHTGLSTARIVSWIDRGNDSVAWTTTNVYSLLNSAANGVGGTLNTLFDAQKVIQGIDH